MQQAGVVRVLDILEHQLPVARQPLPLIAEDFELAAVEYAVEIGEHQRPEIVLQRLVGLRETGEDDTVTRGDREAFEPVLLGPEILGHAALALVAAAERYP